MINVHRFKSARKHKGFSQQELANRTNLSVQAIRKIEQGKTKDSLSIPRIASVLGVEADYLRGKASKDAGHSLPELIPATGRLLKLVGLVEAGVWREAVMELNDDEEVAPIIENTRYTGFEQYLLRVVGNSMNMYYRPNDLLHCIKLAFAPRDLLLVDGDHVIVTRETNGLFECTVKELSGGELWPRSHDKAYQTPVKLGESEGETVTITALVVGSYSSRKNR